MKKLIKTFAILLLFVSMISCTTQPESWTVDSPSENILFEVFLDDSHQAKYNISILDSEGKKEVVANSPMGIKRRDASFITNLTFVSQAPEMTLSESFSMPTGKRKIINTEANEMSLTFKNETGNLIEIIVRVTDDGAAFRYRFPESDEKLFFVEEEITGFNFSGEGKTWMAPYDKVTTYSPGYERYFENGIPIGTNAPDKEGWCLPALFETENAWVLLTEAALDSTYFGSHLQPDAEGGLYKIRMPEENEANNVYSHIPESTLPWATPWRVFIIGQELSDVVESDFVVALNPPSKIEDESWIVPGRSSWSWWSDWPSSKDYNKLKKFIDLAVEMGWEYSLVDANWDMMEGGNIEQLIEYANSKNIKIQMWYNSGGAHNDVTERPRDIMSDPVARKAEFKKLEEWGVKGIKVDFFQSDKPRIIKQYFDILKDAADHKIIVNFHGCTMPRGWKRTWPNLVTMEAVRGAETYGFGEDYPEKAVWHNTILPYTRNVIGPMDYTPVTFSNQKFPHLTTYAHEMALSVVFESGVLHFADNCESYRTLPEKPKTFLKTVPVTWDESLLLSGYPGKNCVMARRNGDTWYVAGINGLDKNKNWEIDLSRLGDKSFNVEIITDGSNDKEFSTQEISLTTANKLKVSVLSKGGFVATLKSVE